MNNDPVAQNDSAQTRAGPTAGLEVPIDVLANDSDPDGQVLDVSVPIGPSNGTIIVSPSGLIRYTPNPGFSGNDVFNYEVSDGAGGTDTATITVNVIANQNPVAIDDAATTSVFPGSVEIRVFDNDSDPEGDALPYRDIVFVTQPQNGFPGTRSASATARRPCTRRTRGFRGSIPSPIGRSTSSAGQSNIATVTVTVGDVASPPVAVNDAATTFKDQAITINVLANDTDARDRGNRDAAEPGRHDGHPRQPGPGPVHPGVGVPRHGDFPVPGREYRRAARHRDRDGHRAEPRARGDRRRGEHDRASLPVAIPVLSNDNDPTTTRCDHELHAGRERHGRRQQGEDLEYTANAGLHRHRHLHIHDQRRFGGTATATVTVSATTGIAHRRRRSSPAATALSTTRDEQPGETVTFDSSASFAPGSQITGCEWRVNARVQDAGCGTQVPLSLSEGVNTRPLVVFDDVEPTARARRPS